MEYCEVPSCSLRLPWSGDAAIPAVRGAARVVDRARTEQCWEATIEPEAPSLEIELSLGNPEAFLFPELSIPALWLADEGRSVTTPSLICAGPDLTPFLRLAFSRPVLCGLSRRGDACVARFSCAVAPSAIASAAQQQLTVRAEIADQEGELLRPLHRDVPDGEAARRFLALFAFLDLLSPGRFGAPTQMHGKILEALAERRAFFRNLKEPNDFELLDAPDAAGPAGYVARWSADALLFLSGTALRRSLPGGGGAWHLLGEGTATIDFSRDVKGLTVLTFDCYGRPRHMRGARPGEAQAFSLRPGELLMIEEA